jgi:hypothetical protein
MKGTMNTLLLEILQILQSIHYTTYRHDYRETHIII